MSLYRTETDGPQPASPLLPSEGDIPLDNVDRKQASTSAQEYSSPEIGRGQGLRRRKPLNESPARTYCLSKDDRLLSAQSYYLQVSLTYIVVTRHIITIRWT